MDIFCRDVKPFAPPTLTEIRYWLAIIKEHALLIRLGLPCDQTELSAEAQQYIDVFADLERRSSHLGDDRELFCFAGVASVAAKRIFVFKRRILHCLLECRLPGSCLYPLFVDHLSREAMYFVKLLGKLRYGYMRCPVDAIVSENVFWLRIMTDHLAFIRGMIDPSERILGEQAASLGLTFERLTLRARDLSTMLWHYRPTDELVRFQRELVQSTTELRQFLIAAETLIKQCSAVSTIHPALAGHYRRETEHFLVILEMIREYLSCAPSSPGDE
ncbi:MAG TPA: DUF2935 domain-containing protein [Selenomonadales bacterium]|nr:DUF2935 domain-containing protein [Selenomonadales bacterium]